jgi:metal-responsive CopG/Arc/MetJ family transcriptional regulator
MIHIPTIDNKLIELLDTYIEDNDISNKSKYIESLIRKDMEERGKNTKRDF